MNRPPKNLKLDKSDAHNASTRDTWDRVFQHHYDHAIFGSGLAACAAALHLADTGARVVLISRHGDIAWEWSRAYELQTGTSTDPLWKACMRRLQQVGALRDTSQGPLVDGAAAELVLLDSLRQAGVDLAFMLWPVGVGQDTAGHLQSLALACKDGLRRISAARWIDASEIGGIHCLLGGQAPRIDRRRWHPRLLRRRRWRPANECRYGSCRVDGRALYSGLQKQALASGC